jgi:predicted amidohydrolase YtcJ
MKIYSILFCCLTVLFVSCDSKKETVDLIIHNGNIITIDDNKPVVQALAVSNDKIFATGTNKEILSLANSETKVIDLLGKTAIPGLIEGHAHFMSYGYSMMKLRLNNLKNWAEIVTLIEKSIASAKPGEWIIGRGWHQEKWDKIPTPNVSGYPVNDLLSKVSPNNPVYLTHASGHGIIANNYAMKLAGISPQTPDPLGGLILHDSKGKPTGVFLENADTLIINRHLEYLEALTPEQKLIRKTQALNLANQGCLKMGITSFHDAGASYKEIDFYKSMVDSKQQKVRLWVMLEEENDILKKSITPYIFKNYGNNRLTIGGIKRYMDGALGSHGAWLIEPYKDLPESRGLNTIDLAQFEETAEIAIQSGLQLCTHSIGDLANRTTLDIYEKVMKKYAQGKDLRWRVEHAQHLHPDDIGRFASLGIIPVMQSVHCTSDGPWVIKKLGEQRSRKGAYVWCSLMDSGAIIANGTDAPVESINPFENYYSAVTRKMSNGQAFYPEQIMTREEALRSYTINPAFAAFEENIKGSLSLGKLADITVLSQNILTVDEEKIADTYVIYTIVGGKILYQQ